MAVPANQAHLMQTAYVAILAFQSTQRCHCILLQQRLIVEECGACTVQARDCLSSLDLSTLQAPDNARFRELWALVSLAQAVGEPQTALLCPQERGALAYQVHLPALLPA